MGEPLTGEPLGDPFPWVPLLSPLNMVVKAGAGSGWARRAAGGGQWRASSLVAWLGSGEVGPLGTEREAAAGRPLPAGEAGAAAHAPTLAHTHARSCTTSLGGKSTAQRAGRPSLLGSQGRFGLVTPTGPGGACSDHTQVGKTAGPRRTGLQTDRQTHAGKRRLRDGGPASERGLGLINSQHSCRAVRATPTRSCAPPTSYQPGCAGGPRPLFSTRHPGLCIVFSSNVIRKPVALTPDSLTPGPSLEAPHCSLQVLLSPGSG